MLTKKDSGTAIIRAQLFALLQTFGQADCATIWAPFHTSMSNVPVDPVLSHNLLDAQG